MKLHRLYPIAGRTIATREESVHANNLIQFQPTHRGMILTLPRRVLGATKKTGWLPLVLGLFPLLFGLSWCASIFKMFQAGGAQAGVVQIFLIVFTAVGLVPMWFGLKIFALGVAILRDQTYASIEVTDKNLICYESFYGFSFRRKIPALPINQLVIRKIFDLFSNPNNGPDVEPDSDSSQNIPAFIRELLPDDLRVLATSKKMGKCILAAYPERIITESATLLKKELDDVQFRLPSAQDTVGDGDTPEASNTPVTIINTTQQGEREPSEVQSTQQPSTSQFTSSAGAVETNSPVTTPTQTPAEPPAGSTLKVTQQDGTDVYEVPAQGWGNAKSLVLFALFWNGFMLFFTGATIWGLFQNPQMNLLEIVGIFAFESLFWMVGIGLAIWAWNRATCSAMIGVEGEQMFIESKTIWGTKWVEFNQSEIHSISVQNSGASVNDVPIKHLAVETEDQAPLGLFSNLANEELYWLAGRLKQSLKFKWKNRLDIRTALNDDGEIIAPEKTRLVVDHSVNHTIVSIPASSLLTQLSWQLFTCLALAITSGTIWFLLNNGGSNVILFAAIFGGTFVAIGIASVLFSSRRWTVLASPERLTITRRWLLGTSEQTYERDDIKNICIGSTGVKTGHETHYRLVVHTHQKKKAMTLMDNWSVKELKYVAAIIYDALKIDLTNVVDE